jgi:hypothetical protein
MERETLEHFVFIPRASSLTDPAHIAPQEKEKKDSAYRALVVRADIDALARGARAAVADGSGRDTASAASVEPDGGSVYHL